MIQYVGLVWIGILFLSAWSLIGLAGSSLQARTKMLWAAAILLLPLLGALAWMLVGAARARRQ